MSYTPEIGTIIHATHRLQDLLPAFLDELKNVDPTAYEQLIVNNALVPAYVYDEGEGSEWWESYEAECLCEDLFNALDSCAPDNCYFGAHPGDGSDFGYWPIEDDE